MRAEDHEGRRGACTPWPVGRMRRRALRGPRNRTVLRGAGTIAGAFLLTGGLLTAAARIMARIPLLPDPAPGHGRDTVVRAVHPDRVHLDTTAETARGGLLALRQSGGAVHVRLGPVTARPTSTTVSRPLLASDGTEPLHCGPATVNGFFWAGTPRTAHDLQMQEVQVDSPVGPMPSWLVRPVPARARATGAEDTWAILVHGHGATRGEGLRVIPLLRELGLTSLTITYRNDIGAPRSADAMHHLGSAEWEDCEAAIRYALEHGARRVVLIGWSMGGGIVLRTALRTAQPEAITTLVLDSPAVDWRDILTHHAKALKAPRPVRALALWMMTSPLGARMVRLREPLALHEMTAEHYARHLRTPTLLLHAADDATVPFGPSRQLAVLAPDRVRYVGVNGASHTREWNLDPERYERVLADHLVSALGLDVDIATLDLPVRDPASAPGPEATGERR